MEGRLRISESEWVIMKALWNGGTPMTLGDIVKTLGSDNKWSYTTVRTLIMRLVDKDAVSIDKSSGVYLYSAKFKQDECVRDEVKSFISRVFDDSPARFVAALVKDGELDEAEKSKILRILSDIKEE